MSGLPELGSEKFHELGVRNALGLLKQRGARGGGQGEFRPEKALIAVSRPEGEYQVPALRIGPPLRGDRHAPLPLSDFNDTPRHTSPATGPVLVRGKVCSPPRSGQESRSPEVILVGDLDEPRQFGPSRAQVAE